MLINCGIFLALLGAIFFSSSLAVFSTANCGTAKSCLRLSSECDAASADCVFFSWIWNGTSFQMELSGGTGGGSTYSAVAFGQVDAMQDADLYYCTGLSLKSGVIVKLHDDPTPLDITNEAGVTDITATTTDGVAQCTFTRAASITKTISNSASKDFDLSSGTYYVLLARGNIETGTIQYHDDRMISSLYDMTASPSTSTAAPSSTATQAAGCGVTKGCFQDPSGCAEDTPDCTYFTWAYDSTNKNWNMEISGGTGGGATYAGVAFGQVSGMRDADLYYCTGSALVPGAIVGNQQPPQLSASTPGLTDINTATTNGVAKCTFTRPASVMTLDSTGKEHDYDLSAASYYVLLARGVMNGGVVTYHGNNRAISANKLDLTTNTGAGAPSTGEVISVTPTTKPRSASTCKFSEGCFQYPTGCNPENPDCVHFSWSFNKISKTYSMQISGGVGGGNTYSAVAFGQARKMEDADLYYCTGNALQSGAITTFHDPPQQLNIMNESGISGIVSANNNGVANCSFVRAASVTKPIAGGGTKAYDITDGKHYILLARGPMTAGVLGFHETHFLVSTDKVSGAATVFPGLLKLSYWPVLLAVSLIILNF